MDLNPPSSFICPITGAIMQDPVVDAEGNSYERFAIEMWLQSHDTSPLTRNPLNVAQLVTNRALKGMIEQYVEGELSVNATAQQTDSAMHRGDRASPCAHETTPSVPSDLPTVTNMNAAVVTHKDFYMATYDTRSLFLELIIPDRTVRSPLNICCVIDVSGSMGEHLGMRSAEGVMQKFAMSVLDIVKHATKTVIRMLDYSDNLSIVTFSDSAKRILHWTPMGINGQAHAVQALENVKPTYTTNIWAGLECALILCEELAIQSRTSHVLLLTDGQPNISPSIGEVRTMARYLSARTKLQRMCTVHTFGFGYSIDSTMLVSLAQTGGGQFAFIPDGSMVGTVFVHTVANLMCVVGSHATAAVDMFLQSGERVHKEVWLGCLHAGQNRHVLLPITLPAESGHCLSVSVVLTGTDATGGSIANEQLVETVPSFTISRSFETNAHSIHHETELQRQVLITLARYVVDHFVMYVPSFKNQPQLLKSAFQQLQASMAIVHAACLHQWCVDGNVLGLFQSDIDDQVAKAIHSTDNMLKWGLHYLYSFGMAHRSEIRNNFKDASVQHYGNQLFQSQLLRGDDIFLSIPPPKNANHDRSLTVTNMVQFHHVDNSCFSGDTLVVMAEGRALKRMDEIQRGDRVATTDANGMPAASTVVGIVVSSSSTSEGCMRPMFQVRIVSPSVSATPSHPIRTIGTKPWRRPGAALAVRHVARVYNLVLDSHHVLRLNGGIECVTLGHGIQDSAVATHDYFGNMQRVLADLENLPNWLTTGKVQVARFHRDPVTRWIVKMC